MQYISGCIGAGANQNITMSVGFLITSARAWRGGWRWNCNVGVQAVSCSRESRREPFSWRSSRQRDRQLVHLRRIPRRLHPELRLPAQPLLFQPGLRRNHRTPAPRRVEGSKCLHQARRAIAVEPADERSLLEPGQVQRRAWLTPLALSDGEGTAFQVRGSAVLAQHLGISRPINDLGVFALRS